MPWRRRREVPALSALVTAARSTVRTTTIALADEATDLENGWAVRTRALPRVWTLNQVHLTAPCAATELVAIADAHQADLDYRYVLCDFDADAHGLLEPLGGDGWTAGRELLMVTTAPTRGGRSQVVELDEVRMLALMRRWLIEDREGISEEGLTEVLEYNRREGELWREVRLGVLDDAGQPVAATKLRRSGALAWVEDVYTVPTARGRGHASSLVGEATARAFEAGATAAFLVADDEDWPKDELYAKVGFEGVAKTHTLRRSPAPS